MSIQPSTKGRHKRAEGRGAYLLSFHLHLLVMVEDDLRVGQLALLCQWVHVSTCNTDHENQLKSATWIPTVESQVSESPVKLALLPAPRPQHVYLFTGLAQSVTWKASRSLQDITFGLLRWTLTRADLFLLPTVFCW